MATQPETRTIPRLLHSVSGVLLHLRDPVNPDAIRLQVEFQHLLHDDMVRDDRRLRAFQSLPLQADATSGSRSLRHRPCQLGTGKKTLAALATEDLHPATPNLKTRALRESE